MTRSWRGCFYIPAFDKVFETLTPLDALALLALRWLLVLQLGDRLPYYISKQIDESGSGLHLGAIGWEGKAVLGDFKKADTEGPDIGCDCIGLAGDTLRSHVVGSADERVGVAFRTELAGHAEIAKADETLAGEEDIGRLDIYEGNSTSALPLIEDENKYGLLTSVYDSASMEIRQAIKNPFCNFS